jgi:hypothetical protein
MKWALVMMAMGTTRIQTNLVYDDLQACYAAEEKIAAEFEMTLTLANKALPKARKRMR